jgi:sugar transferase (PEP-CTERM system associated)
MIKVFNQYVPIRLPVLLITESALILLVWAFVALLFGVWDATTYPYFVLHALVATAICQLCLSYGDVYDLRSVGTPGEVFFRLVQALGAAMLLLGILLLFLPDVGLNSRVVETSILATVAVLLMWRVAVDRFTRTYGVRERVLLVGSSVGVRKLAREMGRRPDLSMRMVGIVSEKSSPSDLVDGLPNLGVLPDLESIIDRVRPNRVILGLAERRQALPIDMLLKKRTQGLVFEEASALYQKITGKVPVESINPSELIFSDGFTQSWFRGAYSRLISIVGASLGLILFSPVMVLASIAIKLDSKGPVLYGQMRVGKNGQPFEILKFRTMSADAETQSGPTWAKERDPRITRVGGILRKLRIDEMPQFLNLLYGDMKFVGPRPERPHFVAQLSEEIPYYDLRHSVRPGLTGWAQVKFAYAATIEDTREKLEYDLFYIKNASFWLDLLILFRTVKIILFRTGAR